MMHPFERRALEREAQAAVDAVDRLGRALVANAEELECRAEQLASVRAAVEANRAKMESANALGVRIVFDGSRREAEPLFAQVPMSTVAAMESAIADGERLAAEESRLLAAVTNCDRERDRLTRTLDHWRRVSDGLHATVVAMDAPEATTTDSPTDARAPVGTAEEEAVERAEAVAATAPGAQPAASSQPVASSSALNLRDRLAALSERVARW